MSDAVKARATRPWLIALYLELALLAAIGATALGLYRALATQGRKWGPEGNNKGS
jgi:hypothetical protein